jgi:hypothetical protein
MSSHIKDALADAWAEDLKARVPAGHEVFASRRPSQVQPPFSVVVVMAMEQTTPGSGAWMADVKVVSVCDKEQGGSEIQKRRLGEIAAALEATVPGADAARGVRLCGFSVDEVRQAKAEKVYSDVIFVTAGVERLFGG